jgi:hypothetical protein
MKCEKYSNLIDDLVEGELDRQSAEEVNLHLFGCAECTAQFEILQREKEMYAHYLYEVEPPIGMPAKFQQILETEAGENVPAVQTTFPGFVWVTQLFAFIRLNPALMTAVLLVLVGLTLALLNSLSNKPTQENNLANQPNTNIQLMLPNLPEKEIILPTPKKDETAEVKPPTEIAKKEAEIKPVAVRQVIKKDQPKVLPKKDGLTDEERSQIKAMQALDVETAKQLEKVELLLRSFRNISYAEGSQQYDVAYEKQQARRLLQNNIELRQRAESYGTLFTEEMLSRVEPYLLDIANLELNPTAEKVSEIKERVRNQNIIASLQSF